jgi:hypothetical protein
MYQLLAMIQRDAAEAWARRAPLWQQVALVLLLPMVVVVWTRAWGPPSGLDAAEARGALGLGLVVLDLLWTATITWSRSIYRAQVRGELEVLVASGVNLPRLLVLMPAFAALCSLARCLLYMTILLGFFGASMQTVQLHSAVVFLLLAGFGLGALGVMSMCLTLMMRSPEPLGPALWGACLLICGPLAPSGSLPPWLEAVGAALPPGALLLGLRGSLLRGASLPQLHDPLLFLGSATLVLLALAWALARYTRRLLRWEGVPRGD